MKVELQVNGARRRVDVEPRTTLVDCLRDQSRPHRHACRLRARHLRRLHGAARRRAGARLLDVRRAGRRLRDHHHRGGRAGAGRAQHRAGCVLRDPWPAMRVLHARHDPHRGSFAAPHSQSDPRRHRQRDLGQSSAAAPATVRSSKRSRSPPSASPDPTCRAPRCREPARERAGETSSSWRRRGACARIGASSSAAGDLWPTSSFPACCMSRWCRRRMRRRASSRSMRRRRSRCRASTRC